MKSKGSKFFITICVLVIVAVSWFVFRDKLNIGSAPTQTGSKDNNVTTIVKTKIYQNSTYGFSFSYPDNLELTEYSPEHISVAIKEFGGVTPIVDINLVKSSPEIQVESFEEFVLDQTRVNCSSSTPTISFSCTSIDNIANIKPFTSKAGVPGQVFYLKAEEKTLTTGGTVTKHRGPFYTFNTSSATPNSMSFLLINNPVNRDASKADLPVIESIASSVVLYEASAQ